MGPFPTFVHRSPSVSGVGTEMLFCVGRHLKAVFSVSPAGCGEWVVGDPSRSLPLSRSVSSTLASALPSLLVAPFNTLILLPFISLI